MGCGGGSETTSMNSQPSPIRTPRNSNAAPLRAILSNDAIHGHSNPNAPPRRAIRTSRLQPTLAGVGLPASQARWHFGFALAPLPGSRPPRPPFLSPGMAESHLLGVDRNRDNHAGKHFEAPLVKN